MEAQEPGQYPRLNAAMLRSNQYHLSIVSIVGKFVLPSATNGAAGIGSGGSGDLMNVVHFQTSDEGIILVNIENANEVDVAAIDYQKGPVVELVGQAVDEHSLMLFVVRTLSEDMDLQIYNRMLQVQQHPKFAHYFSTTTTTSSSSSNNPHLMNQ